jgi:hypothetical protein
MNAIESNGPGYGHFHRNLIASPTDRKGTKFNFVFKSISNKEA